MLPIRASAADLIPAHLTGAWGTGASLYDGKQEQADVYLLPDGLGMMAGSSAPAHRADGVDDGKPGPRAIVGYPVHAKMDSDTLVLHPFLPAGVPGMKAEFDINCRYAQADKTLTCTWPDNKSILLKRRGDTVPAEVMRMTDQVEPKNKR
ncbi:hypothetical protein [Duganella levis]|uniref:DUF3757 domain-containing protein n=1 Tax=Duganella levis TaxID=2692169 RepID=A0ABW9W821_9BURK|nr:hypothetical protein [Duganella levis]MYN29744.1 hypothetical protein [Duganella levis]